ncbi:MAG: hypothetical protein RBU37_01115 [Myxococcota bacterium]|jgi:hypothetical protein|nr:hypothetical protein [Myxococcota bacterium]
MASLLGVEKVLSEEHLRDLLHKLLLLLREAGQQEAPRGWYGYRSALGVQLGVFLESREPCLAFELRLSHRGAWMPSPLARVLLVFFELTLQLDSALQHRQSREGIFSLRFELDGEEQLELSASVDTVQECLRTALAEARELDIEYVDELHEESPVMLVE